MLMSLACHTRTVWGDPGFLTRIPSLVSRAPPKEIPHPRMCRICKLKWKPPRAHHCRKCQQCVFRMDHHCAWVNNCVGFKNQKFFILFLLYTLLLGLYEIGLYGVALWYKGLGLLLNCQSGILVVLAGCVTGLSMYIVWEFLSEQWVAIKYNQTLVESHQLTQGATKTIRESLEEVFGTNYLGWPFPVAPSQVPVLEEPVFLVDEAASKLARSADDVINIYIVPNHDIGVEVGGDAGEYVSLKRDEFHEEEDELEEEEEEDSSIMMYTPREEDNINNNSTLHKRRPMVS